ncbi:MAG TPA: K(+)-transporting ATPase subunit C [Kofleriaceae bacterium]|jgi:K+-transporting ATPase ATPase C chain
MKTLVIAARTIAVTLVVTGLIYPLVVTGLAQLLFPYRAGGSIVTVQGREVGSELIGQAFTTPPYVHSRPSASGTNLSVTSKKLHDSALELAKAYRVENGLADGVEIPADAVSSSASGIDPHISPENARLQVARIAKARGVAQDRVRAIVDEYTETPWLGVIGEPRVDVLQLDLALDRTFGVPTHLTAR